MTKRHLVLFVLLGIFTALCVFSVIVTYQDQHRKTLINKSHHLVRKRIPLRVAIRRVAPAAHRSALMWEAGIVIPLGLMISASILLLLNYDQPRVFGIAKLVFWLTPVAGAIFTSQ